MIYNWLKTSLFRIPSALFTKQCLLCLSSTKQQYQLCLSCEQDLPQNTHHCIICASPLLLNHTTENVLVCGRCQKKPPHFTTSIIPHIYASPLKQLIHQFKFRGQLKYAPLLANSFLSGIKNRKSTLPECIIPVPLHPQRLQQRGLNQALEICKIISKQLNLPTDYSICTRNKDTPFQSGLSAAQRKKNLKDAFHVQQDHHYKHVAIFDDVVTTGTTVNELAKQLKLSGVEKIEIWAIARTSNVKFRN